MSSGLETVTNIREFPRFPVQVAERPPLKRRSSGGFEPQIIPEAVARMYAPQVEHIRGEREVLDNLCQVGVGLMREGAGNALVQRVTQDVQIKRVAFMGPPGVGKSTIIEQFMEALFEKLGQSLRIKITSFDPIFKRMLDHIPRQFWDHYSWEFINDSLYVTSKERGRATHGARRTRQQPGREIEIIETPFVGTEDRGRSFMQRAWKEAQGEGTDGMLFVPVVEIGFRSHQSNTVKQVATRSSMLQEISQAKKLDEKLRILTRFGIDISSQIIKKSKKKIESMIDTLLAQFRNSATNAQRAIVAKDFKAEMKVAVPSFLTPYLLDNIPLPSIRGDVDEVATRRQVFYWERVFDEMGVPTQNRFITINPPLQKVHRKPGLIKKAA